MEDEPFHAEGRTDGQTDRQNGNNTPFSQFYERAQKRSMFRDIHYFVLRYATFVTKLCMHYTVLMSEHQYLTTTEAKKCVQLLKSLPLSLTLNFTRSRILF